jgi:hypothetical protein
MVLLVGFSEPGWVGAVELVAAFQVNLWFSHLSRAPASRILGRSTTDRLLGRPVFHIATFCSIASLLKPITGAGSENSGKRHRRSMEVRDQYR